MGEHVREHGVQAMMRAGAKPSVPQSVNESEHPPLPRLGQVAKLDDRNAGDAAPTHSRAVQWSPASYPAKVSQLSVTPGSRLLHQERLIKL